MNKKIIFYFLLISTRNSSALADTHTYELPAGLRAQGMANTQTAVANDSAAIIYNPACLQNVTSKSISGSVNNYLTSQTVYEAIPSSPEVRIKFNGTGGFVGFAKPVHFFDRDFVAGFSLHTPYAINNEQEFDYKGPKELNIKDIHSVTKEAYTNRVFMIGASTRYSEMLALGFGLGVSYHRHSKSQYMRYWIGPMDFEGAPRTVFARGTQEVFSELDHYDIESILGITLKSTDDLTFGLSARFLVPIYTRTKGSFEAQSLYLDENDVPFSAGEIKDENRKVVPLKKRITGKSAFKQTPVTIRAGIGWQTTDDLLVAFDVVHSTKQSVKEDQSFFDSRKAVTNLSAGTEYRFFENSRAFGGFSTDFDGSYYNGRDTKEGNEKYHVWHVTTGYALALETSEISLSMGYEWGNGKARPVNVMNKSVERGVSSQGFLVAFTINSIEGK